MTLAPEIQTPSPIPESNNLEFNNREIPQEEILAFGQRLYDRFEKTMSTRDRLSALFQIDREGFEEEIEDEVEDYLNEDTEFQEIFSEFLKERKHGGGDSFVPELKSRREKARGFIMASLNLPTSDQEELKSIDESKQNVNLLLEDIPKTPENISAALETLGCKIPREDEPGKYTYSYPYELLPSKVNKKWEDYLDSVTHHIETFDKINANDEFTREAYVNADRLRRIAHDSVTHEVHSILQLNRFGWSEKETRNLLAHMRDDQLSIDRAIHRNSAHMSPEEVTIATRLAKHRFHH